MVGGDRRRPSGLAAGVRRGVGDLAPAQMTHVPQEPFQVRYPGGKDGMWRVWCSCEKYVTGFHGRPAEASKAAQAHADALNAR